MVVLLYLLLVVIGLLVDFVGLISLRRLGGLSCGLFILFWEFVGLLDV